MVLYWKLEGRVPIDKLRMGSLSVYGAGEGVGWWVKDLEKPMKDLVWT